MDRQTTNIPVNTRVVGDAGSISEGIYVLYLEDYVHTFIKKLIYEQNACGVRESGAELMADAVLSLYGSSFENASQKIMVVSGAMQAGQTDKDYFPKNTLLGTALVGLNKDRGIRLEITANGTKVILDDFYIYYDQNEEMQNYLIDWNHHRQKKGQEPKPTRAFAENAAQTGRGEQENPYQREQAQTGGVWGAMNVLSLGLIACVLVYGVISLNSYEKMQSMQEGIDYCMAFVTETLENNTENNSGQITEQYAAEEMSAEPSETQPTQDAQEQETQTDEAAQEPTETQPAETAVQTANTSVPQYYVVQRGDTLRGICMSVYGDYSRMEEICTLNGLDNPDSILYGQKLLLP